MRSCLGFCWVVILAGSVSVANAEPADVGSLIKALEGTDAQAQLDAADSLGALHGNAAEAVPALANALSQSNAVLRWHALRALGEFGAAADKAVPEVTKALTDKDPVVRAHAAHALGEIGDKAKPAVAGLSAAITDSDARVRRAALDAIRKIRPDPKTVLPLMAKVLEEGDAASIAKALHSIAESGADAVPNLITALDHPKARYWACLALAEIGPAAKAAVPALEKALTDQDPETDSQAAIALGAIGPDAKSAVPALVKALKSEHGTVRYAATLALGKIGDPSAKDALSQIKGDDEFMQMIAAWSLAKISPQDAGAQSHAIATLVKGLQSKSEHSRRLAARTLFELNASPEITAPALVAAMQDADPETVQHAHEALASLGPKIVPLIRKRLSEATNDKLPIHAVRVLALIGPDAKDAVPELTALLDKSSDPLFTTAVLDALGRIGPDSAPAVSAIQKQLESKSLPVQYAASYALGKIGPAAKACTGELCKNLEAEDTFLRMVTGWALLHINPDNKDLRAQAVPKLIEGLSHGDERVRMEAATTLGELGADAASAVPALTKLQNDPEAIVRKAAEAALSKIQKP